MKILFIGDSESRQYVKALYERSTKLNDVEAERFSYGLLARKNKIVQLEKHFKNGLMTVAFNRRLIKQCKNNHYDLVFVYYSTLIYGNTIKKIRKAGCKVFMYCNDNPFSKDYRPYVWRHLIRQIPHYDIVYAYRQSNIEEYKRVGAKNVKLLRSYYIKDNNYYIPDEDIDINVPDVVYIGHKEDDGREDYIISLLNEGIDVGLNSSWNNIEGYKGKTVILSNDYAVNKYNEVLNKAKIAIVFLSKLNKDTYTRRCFEIPATKTLMIAPYTDELATMYEEDREIVFFRNKEEFTQKIVFYLKHQYLAKEIGQNGYERLRSDKNELGDRLEEVLADYKDSILKDV